MTYEQFGQYVKELREKRGLSLREFCRLTNLDPSNWSKVERGLLAPPRNSKCLNDIASVLLVEKDSEDWHMLFETAAIGHIPEDLVFKRRLIVESMPIFLRSAREGKINASIINELRGLFEEKKGKKKKV